MTFRNIKYLLNLLLAVSLSLKAIAVSAQTTKPVGEQGEGSSLLPTGKVITPTAAPSSTLYPLSTGLRPDGNADAAEAVKTALSPDGKTLLVLTSGYNQKFNNPTTARYFTYSVLNPTTGQPSSTTTNQAEWVFVYDVSSGTPVKKQQINIPNTYNGMVWAPDGQHFYVSAGIDDRIYVYKSNGTQFVPDAPFILLGHNSNQTAPFPSYDGGLLKGTPAANAADAINFPQGNNGILQTGAVVAELAISKDGSTLFATNLENDSLSIIDTGSRKVLKEVKFFTPGQTTATGEFPFGVTVSSNSNGAPVTAYVSSQRDNEVLAVNVTNSTVTRIPVGGQPNRLLLSPDQTHLYVANGNSDSVSVIDTNTNKVIQTISLSPSGYVYKGANPNSLEFSPDGTSLYVTLGGENAVAVVALSTGQVVGRIPTGWYPTSVSARPDGKMLYVVNAKNTSGPNPTNSRTTITGSATDTTGRNEYTWALEKGGLLVLPVPNQTNLVALEQKVLANNGFSNRQSPDTMMQFLQTKIKHVIYIVKENRTYDQVLGDLKVGNGDPSLTLFPQFNTPNHHQLALNYVTLDNFYDSGESSGVGWNWTTQANTTDYNEKTQWVLYGNGNFNGLTYDYEGNVRTLNIALPQTAANPSPLTVRETGLFDPSGSSSIMPGTKDVNAPDGDGDESPTTIGGFIWDSALRAGKTVRNYGVNVDQNYYATSSNTVDPTKTDPKNPYYLPISPTPFESNLPQAQTTRAALLGKTDTFYRGFDQSAPDIFRFHEWNREFQNYVSTGNLPDLMLVDLPHDHFGNLGNAVAGLNSPKLQIADNDYALGKIVEAVSNSPYWSSTAIFVIEDDSQNGPDHVDSHRSIAYIISPYTKRNAVVSTNYNTVNMVRTVEDILGIGHLNLYDANALAMSDVFTTTPNLTPYNAMLSGELCGANRGTTAVALGITQACNDPKVVKTASVPLLHDSKWWAVATKGFDFSSEDKVDADKFNRLLWAGIMGDKVPYPTVRNHKNLRYDRAKLLNSGRITQR